MEALGEFHRRRRSPYPGAVQHAFTDDHTNPFGNGYSHTSPNSLAYVYAHTHSHPHTHAHRHAHTYVWPVTNSHAATAVCNTDPDYYPRAICDAAAKRNSRPNADP